jgi:hypothetical protein
MTKGIAGVNSVRPGRGSLEWSVMCSALTLVVPVLGLAALGLAVRARNQGSTRWLVAVLAAPWCAFLGALLRLRLGFEVLP